MKLSWSIQTDPAPPRPAAIAISRVAASFSSLWSGPQANSMWRFLIVILRHWEENSKWRSEDHHTFCPELSMSLSSRLFSGASPRM